MDIISVLVLIDRDRNELIVLPISAAVSLSSYIMCAKYGFSLLGGYTYEAERRVQKYAARSKKMSQHPGLKVNM